MTTFKTMTEQEIIRAAWHTVLDNWDREMKHNETLKKDNICTDLSDAKLARYDAQLRELESVLIKMEQA